MFNNQEYNSYKDFDDLVQIISYSKSQKNNYLWQNNNGTRHLFKIHTFEAFPSTSTIKLHIADPDHQFNDQLRTYINLGFRESVFKVKIIDAQGSLVTVAIPKEIMAKEHRHDPRKNFHFSHRKTVVLSLKTQLTKHSSQLTHCLVLDASKNGLALVINDEILNMMKISQGVTLLKVADVDLLEPIECDIVYSKKIRFKRNNKVTVANRVGLHLVQPIDDTSYLLFTA